MSDYLTRLIERSLGAAPQIEPLIAPLHAPPGQILSERTETSAAFGLGSTAKIESSGRETTPGEDAKSRTSEAPFTRRENQRPSVSHPLPESPAGSPIATSDDSSRSLPRLPLPEASSATIPEAAVPLSPPMLSQESTRVVVETEIIQRSRPAAPTERPPRLPENESRVVVQPEIIGRHHPPKSSAIPAPQTSANEPPAIHVTIGRVEVRAVMSPSAPPKIASRAAPKLSLADYLKQRNGGAR